MPRHGLQNPKGEGKRAGSERINAFGVGWSPRLGDWRSISLSFVGADHLVDPQSKQLINANESTDDNNRATDQKPARLRIRFVESLLLGLRVVDKIVEALANQDTATPHNLQVFKLNKSELCHARFRPVLISAATAWPCARGTFTIAPPP